MDGSIVKTSLDQANTVKTETPFIVLRYKKWFIFFGMLVMIFCFWLYSYGTLVPYFTTGDFNEIWPKHKGSITSKAFFFFTSWVFWTCSPITIRLFNIGDIAFYETHIEVEPYLCCFKKRIIFYDLMNVMFSNGRGMILTNGSPGKLSKNPIGYWRTVSLQGIVIPYTSMVLWNPESLDKAIRIIHERAIKITQI